MERVRVFWLFVKVGGIVNGSGKRVAPGKRKSHSTAFDSETTTTRGTQNWRGSPIDKRCRTEMRVAWAEPQAYQAAEERDWESRGWKRCRE
jgi:hypothetical protein